MMLKLKKIRPCIYFRLESPILSLYNVPLFAQRKLTMASCYYSIVSHFCGRNWRGTAILGVTWDWKASAKLFNAKWGWHGFWSSETCFDHCGCGSNTNFCIKGLSGGDEAKRWGRGLCLKAVFAWSAPCFHLDLTYISGGRVSWWELCGRSTKPALCPFHQGTGPSPARRHLCPWFCHLEKQNKIKQITTKQRNIRLTGPPVREELS